MRGDPSPQPRCVRRCGSRRIVISLQRIKGIRHALRGAYRFGGHGKRFKGEPGTGSPRHKLELALFSDEAWPKYLEAVKKGSLCSERMELASSRRELGAPKEAYDKAKRKAGKPVAEFSLDEDFAPRERSHYYYFVLADCTDAVEALRKCTVKALPAGPGPPKTKRI